MDSLSCTVPVYLLKEFPRHKHDEDKKPSKGKKKDSIRKKKDGKKFVVLIFLLIFAIRKTAKVVIL